MASSPKATFGAGRYAYDATLSSKLGLGAGVMMDFSMSAGALIDARVPAAAEIELGVRLQDVQFRSADAASREQFSALAVELTQPFAFRLVRGKLEEVRLRPEWSAFAASIARTLAAAFQFSEPSSGSTKWSADEADATGEYSAEYTQDPKDALRFSKRKLSYAELSFGKLGIGTFGAKLAPKVISSHGSILFAPATENTAAPFRHVEYEEKIETALNAAAPLESSTQLKLELRAAPVAEAALDWTALHATTRSMKPSAPHGSRPPRSAYDPIRIGSYTFDSALRELEQLAQSPSARQVSRTIFDEQLAPAEQAEREASLGEQSKVFSAMAALLRSRPENVPLAVARIRKGSKAARALIDALGSAATDTSQRALVELMNDGGLDAKTRQTAAFALTRGETVSDASVVALSAHLDPDDPLWIHALYGLGTISRRLRLGGDGLERAQAIATTLRQSLVNAPSPSVKVHVLRAIANSGHPSIYEDVSQLLSSDSEKVRAAAIDALRLMPLPAVDALLVRELPRSTGTVQVSILDAIAVREPTAELARALESIAKKPGAAAPSVRATRIMGQWLPRRAELRTVLESLAQNDDRDAVRRAARAALGTPSAI